MSAQRFSRTGRFCLIAAMLNRPGALIVDDDGVRIEPLSGGERAVERWAWADIRRAGLEEIVAEDVVPEVQLVLVRQNGEAEHIRLADFGPPREIAAALRRHVALDEKPWQLVEQMPPRRNAVVLAGWFVMVLCIALLLGSSFLRQGWDGLQLPLLVLGLPLLAGRSAYRRRRPAIVTAEGIHLFEAGFIDAARWHRLAWTDILSIEAERWENVAMLSISCTRQRRFRVPAASLCGAAGLPARLRLVPAACAASASGRTPLSYDEITQRNEELARLAMILALGSNIVAVMAFMPFRGNWHEPGWPGPVLLTVTVLLACAFTVWWLGRAGVRMQPFSSLFSALLLGVGLGVCAVQAIGPLLLEAGWRRAEAVEMRFVATEAPDRQAR